MLTDMNPLIFGAVIFSLPFLAIAFVLLCEAIQWVGVNIFGLKPPH